MNFRKQMRFAFTIEVFVKFGIVNGDEIDDMQVTDLLHFVPVQIV